MKRRSLFALGLCLMGLAGGPIAWTASHPQVTPFPPCSGTLSGMGAYSPSDQMGFGGPSAYGHGVTQAQVTLLSSYVTSRWHHPLAVVDRALGAYGLYGPRYDTTAFVFDTGTVAPAACITDVTTRASDAANLQPAHPPFLVVAVSITSTKTQTGTIPGPTITSVDGDPAVMSAADRADIQAWTERVFVPTP